VVIVPIFKKAEDLAALMTKLEPLAAELRSRNIRVKVDTSDQSSPGFKFANYELKGVPVRLAMGGRDLENGTIEVARRDTLTKETLPLEGIAEHIEQLLADIQRNCYQKALDFRTAHIRTCDSYEEFKTEIQKGGFLLCHWDGTPETEERIKEETKATIRCIPLNPLPGFKEETGKCMVTGKPSERRVVFAIAY